MTIKLLVVAVLEAADARDVAGERVDDDVLVDDVGRAARPGAPMYCSVLSAPGALGFVQAGAVAGIGRIQLVLQLADRLEVQLQLRLLVVAQRALERRRLRLDDVEDALAAREQRDAVMPVGSAPPNTVLNADSGEPMVGRVAAVRAAVELR